MPKGNENVCPRRKWHMNVHIASLIMEKKRKQLQLNALFFSHKKNEVLIPALIWVNFESIRLSERSQSQKTTYHMT